MWELVDQVEPMQSVAAHRSVAMPYPHADYKPFPDNRNGETIAPKAGLQRRNAAND